MIQSLHVLPKAVHRNA